jgi:hypothetical protein
MAQLAHMICDSIINTFQQKLASDNLRDLYAAFQEALLPDLKVSEFADMFAQTIVYGLFAARFNHAQTRPFLRHDAASEFLLLTPSNADSLLPLQDRILIMNRLLVLLTSWLRSLL